VFPTPLTPISRLPFQQILTSIQINHNDLRLKHYRKFFRVNVLCLDRRDEKRAHSKYGANPPQRAAGIVPALRRAVVEDGPENLDSFSAEFQVVPNRTRW
jgi:hypothetical protein